MPYTGLAQPCGEFASMLEAEWDATFRRWGWKPTYVGDTFWWADFDCSGVKIEVKPHGEEFVLNAITRATNILLVAGNRGWHRWYLVAMEGADNVARPLHWLPDERGHRGVA